MISNNIQLTRDTTVTAIQCNMVRFHLHLRKENYWEIIVSMLEHEAFAIPDNPELHLQFRILSGIANASFFNKSSFLYMC